MSSVRDDFEFDQNMIDRHNTWVESVPDEITCEIGRLVMSFSQLDLFLQTAIGERLWPGQPPDESRTIRVVADLTFQQRADLFRSLGRSSTLQAQLDLDEIIHLQLSAAAKSRNDVVHAWYLANSKTIDIAMLFGGRAAPASDWGFRVRKTTLTVDLIRDARQIVVQGISMISNPTYSKDLVDQWKHS